MDVILACRLSQEEDENIFKRVPMPNFYMQEEKQVELGIVALRRSFEIFTIVELTVPTKTNMSEKLSLASGHIINNINSLWKYFYEFVLWNPREKITDTPTIQLRSQYPVDDSYITDVLDIRNNLNLLVNTAMDFTKLSILQQ